jgi:predicted N-acetyltransferase YhbS
MVLVRRENGSQRGAAEGHVGRLNKDGILMIRSSIDSDRAAIRVIHMSAFGKAQGQEIIELVNGLLGDETAKPLLSLVAEINEKIVGHILFTRAILKPEYQDISVRILAPLAVSRELQGEGIGGSLIMEGLKQLSDSGVDLVFVLGHPGYYPKYGFRPAGALGFEAPYPIPSGHADAWMVQELKPGLIGNVQGTIQCAEVLDEPQHWRE